jgi:hypothetical protein
MRRILLVALVIILAASACKIPGVSESLGTVGALVNTGEVFITQLPQALTEMSTLQSNAPGIITGHLSYPGESIPPLKVVAFYVPGASWVEAAEVTTVEGQSEYALTVLDVPGDFYVVAYTLDGRLSAGYSRAVPCGLLASCTDHHLIPVHLEGGSIMENIDPTDWYAPEGAFPEMP